MQKIKRVKIIDNHYILSFLQKGTIHEVLDEGPHFWQIFVPQYNQPIWFNKIHFKTL